jgi:ABC-type uncharacterized transport system permease subunit
MLTTVLALVSLGLYLLAGLIPAMRLARGPEHAPGKPVMLALGTVAIVLHGATIYLSTISAKGLYFEFFEAASIIGLLMAAMTVFFSIRQPAENMATLTLPLAGVVAVLGVLLSTPRPGAPALPSGVGAHVYTSLLAYSVLAVAAFHSVLLALQESKLRHHHPGGFVRLLPPLQTMETLLFQMLAIGFVLLTLSLATGFIFLEDMFAQHLVHKTILSLVAWTLFAILLLGRWRFGWRGQTAVRWTIGGFVALMLAYFGSKFVLELILHRQ